jgi:hypothetical protein
MVPAAIDDLVERVLVSNAQVLEQPNGIEALSAVDRTEPEFRIPHQLRSGYVLCAFLIAARAVMCVSFSSL